MIVGILATFPARKDTLQERVNELLKQVDKLHICLNEYTEIPGWLQNLKNTYPVVPPYDLKATGKFFFEVNNEDLVFLFDDDIPYPDNYVEHSLEQRKIAQDIYGENIITGHHGTCYRYPGIARILWRSFRNKINPITEAAKPKKVYAYYNENEQFKTVAQLGTGTICLKGAQMPPFSFMEGALKFVDVRFARWCHKKKIPHILMPHPENWMPRSGDDEHSIWNSFTQKRPIKRSLEVVQYCYKVPNQTLPK